MRIGPLLEKYPDMIDPLFLYYGSNKFILFMAQPCKWLKTTYLLYFENVKDLKFQNGEKILVSLKKGFQTCQLNQTESFYVAELEEEKRNGKVELIFPNNMKIVETQNFSPVKVKLWMAENCICPESFYEGCVMPGNTVEWMRSYCFGI